MKFVLEAYLWLGLLFGLLTLTFGLVRERGKEQPTWMTALKWMLGAGAAAMAWPVAAYWVLEGELMRRRVRRLLDSETVTSGNTVHSGVNEPEAQKINESSIDAQTEKQT